MPVPDWEIPMKWITSMTFPAIWRMDPCLKESRVLLWRGVAQFSQD